MNLDTEFGPCLPPSGNVSAHELSYQPYSLSALSSETAVSLKEYLHSVRNIRLASITHTVTPILWLVNRDGQIRFSLEEAIDEKTGELMYVIPRLFRFSKDGFVKLGHPALLGSDTWSDKFARIGGEIVFDDGMSPRWTITNSSGRYGFRQDTTKEHLQRVANVFSEFGIELSVYFKDYARHSNA